MEKYLSPETSLVVTIIIGFFFIGLGYLKSKKLTNTKNYIVGDRDEDFFSLTASLTASALGAWILFGPASAATWGGIGAIIGYALGTASPMLFLYNFGPKIRKEFPKGLTLTEFIRKRFGKGVLKICLFLILFYLTIFLIAEVTAIASLMMLISNIPLWISSGIILNICLLYILKGGFKLSVITDKYQFSFIILIIVSSLIVILDIVDYSSLSLISKKLPNLLDSKNLTNYTAGITFFIAVAATNLFHQGNWQRVFAAKNDKVLKKSLISSSLIIFFVVYWMGYTGLISLSLNPKVTADLAFFQLIFSEKETIMIIGILILAISLTLSTVDTLINAISSLIIVESNQLTKIIKAKNIKKISNVIIIILSIFVFIFASMGFSILYLFLLADLLCCAAVVTIFYGFFKNKIDFKIASYSIIISLISGLLFFPDQNFEKSLLVGNLISLEKFDDFIVSNLLFLSFVVSIIVQIIIISFYSLRSSLR